MEFSEEEKTAARWENAYEAAPRFYAKPDGSPFGAFALTEGTDTVLPKALRYAIGGRLITDYRLFLVSTSKDRTIGSLDYFTALRKLEGYRLDDRGDAFLIRGLSLEELEGILS